MKIEKDPQNKKYLLLDSCIVEYLFNSYINPPLTLQLKKWSNKIFDFAISEISYAELLDGAKKDKDEEVMKSLKKYNSFPITERIIQGCGKLGSVYREHNQEFKSADIGDRIIASTSIVHNVLVVTANVQDFPYPFFNQIASENIIYTKNSKDKMICIAVMRPNYKFIINAFNNRN